jgi:hypothetical protein
MASQMVWTLSQAARLLKEPQHRLIYLCEKRVVVPDFADATGRGSSRRFSARNLLEFAVALNLRTLGLPAGTIAAILYTLRAFEKRVAAEIPGFDLSQGLRGSGGIDLRAVIGDGERLYFLLGQQGRDMRLFGGVDLKAAASVKPAALASRLKPLPRAAAGTPGRFGRPEDSCYVRVEIDISQIARVLRTE